MSITEFLEARITEDETEANERAVEEWFDGGWPTEHCNKILAECAAKRAIIAECRPSNLSDLDAGEDDQPAPMWVARALAAVYKDHPDYREQWGL